MKEATKRFWILLGYASVAIHAVFCIQAFLPLRQGGMASNGPWLTIFYPQYILDFYVPPSYPITDSGGVVHVNYLAFWGKMLVAFPASVAYASLLAGLALIIARWRQGNVIKTIKLASGAFALAAATGFGLLVFGSIYVSLLPSHVDWDLVVPAGYEGYLVLRWDCPGGVGLVRQSGKITVPFSVNGTFCTTNSVSETAGQVLCRDTTGTSIPYVAAPSAASGTLPSRIVCSGGNRAMEIAGRTYQFLIFWVGNPGAFQPSTAAEGARLNAFLHDRFGLPNGALDPPAK